MQWDASDYVWRQVADVLATRISDGTYPAGSALPIETALAAELGVSKGSVRKAIAELRDRGLVHTLHGRGTFVTKPVS